MSRHILFPRTHPLETEIKRVFTIIDLNTVTVYAHHLH